MSALIFCAIFDWVPIGEEAMELRGNKLPIGMAGTAIAGALMKLGIVLHDLMGMNPIAALLAYFSAAIVMRKDVFSASATVLVMSIGSVGVLVASFFVTKMDIILLRWLTAVVLLYTS